MTTARKPPQPPTPKITRPLKPISPSFANKPRARKLMERFNTIIERLEISVKDAADELGVPYQNLSEYRGMYRSAPDIERGLAIYEWCDLKDKKRDNKTA